MVMRRFNLEETLEALGAVHREKGFVTYELVGAKIGLSRQGVQIGLRRAVDKGLVPESIYDKYWPAKQNNKTKKEIKFFLDPDTVEFVKSMANQLKVKPNVIVEAAITVYRRHLTDPATPPQ